MAAKRTSTKNSSIKYPGIVMAIILVLMLVSWVATGEPPELLDVFLQEFFPEPFGQDAALSIAFFDVGQGDCTLIGCNGEYILIDAGENGSGPGITRALRRMGVREIDILVGTHPHSDHIGGLDYVIENIEVASVYMPDIARDTKTYRDVLDAIGEADLRITIPDAGDTLILGDMTIVFLHPPQGERFEETNDYSIVTMIANNYGSVLVTGDAEALSEEMMLNSQMIAPVDVLKVGHHGSWSSTTEAFLQAVDPKVAVISCSEGNDFGHPHREVLALLDENEVTVYRTDEDGTIKLILNDEGMSGISNK